MHVAYDFNATPVAHLGTRIVVHKKPTVRGGWEIRGIDGWYLSEALHHYQCFEVFENNNAHIRIAYTVDFPRITLP